ncbi:TOUSLED, partial [Symbiodinium pilosum]
MIGKGGFSDIYKAFDLELMCFCAIKLNEIETKMSDSMRADMVRWAVRETDIQKTLQHPRIVQMRECFPLDSHVFVLVLELCEGETLDTRLKANGPLPEKEAKAIVVQILSGLRYLNICGRKIIHYDIKPSNVFYHAGQVKIGDFGLSKMADTSPEGIIELSTRGAGTSWYLPPE